MNERADDRAWREVLEFWFPEGRSLQIDAEIHRDHWFWRMRGGADGEIETRFSQLTAEGAAGNLGHWTSDPEGRLALIIVLDQFSRSVWRGSSRAFAQDPAALALAIEGLSNGHYAALPTPWFKVVHGLPLGHCEGPDHLERLDLLIRLPAGEIEAAVIDQLRAVFRQPEIVAGTWKAAGTHADEISEADARAALQQLDPLWNELFPTEQARIVALLVERVNIGAEGLNVRLRVDGLGGLAREMLVGSIGEAA